MINLKESKEICEKKIPGPKSSPVLDVRAEAYGKFQSHATAKFPEALRLLEEAEELICTLAGFDGDESNLPEAQERAEKWLNSIGHETKL